MKTISYANFFHETPAPFIDKNLLKQINLNIKHASGIYKISNVITGDCYIGQSKDIFTRIGQHKSLLKHNKHKYKNGDLTILQKAWNKYGSDSFCFETLENCPIEELDEREKYWIEYYQCNHAKTRNGYNTTDGGQGTPGMSSNKGKILINNGKIQKYIFIEDLEYYIVLGFRRGVLPQYTKKRCPSLNKQQNKIKKGYRKGESHYMYGKHHSEEVKEKIKQSCLGKKLSQESKQKISESKMKPIVQLTKQNKFVCEFSSGMEAEEKTGISRTHISQCCNHKRKSTGGYLWRFKDEYMETL